MDYTEDTIDIRQYWQILRRRWLPISVVFGSVVTLTTLITFLTKPIYQASGKLLLKEKQASALPDLPGLGGGLKALTRTSSPLATEAEIIRSVPILQRVVDNLGLKDKEGRPIDVNAENGKPFRKSLGVGEIRETDILSISFKSTDPEEAAVVVNQIIQVYLENNISANRAEAAATRLFIDQELPRAEADVKRLEVALRRFKEQNDTIVLPEEAKVAIQTDGQLQQEISNLRGQLKAVSTRSQVLQSQLGLDPQQGIALSTLSQSPLVQQTLVQYQQVLKEVNEQRKVLRPEHPKLQRLEERLATSQALLNQQMSQALGRSITIQPSRIEGSQSTQALSDLLVEAEIERLGLINQLDYLVRAKAAYQQRTDALPKLEQRQRELERKLTVAQSIYEQLLKSQQQTQIQENQNIGNARTISAALVPEKPIAPRKARNIAIGILLGSLLGIGTALLLEALDNSIKTVKEAQDLFDFTVLATLPLLKEAEKVSRGGHLARTTPDLILRNSPRSPLSEAYRMLQANLKFLSSDRPVKTIVLTSAIPKEGKSTVTANLALALAEHDHRVLIVDADMRRPIQHQIWEQPNLAGLSNILAEQSDWQAHVIPEEDHLDIITAGVVPPNPVPLLDSKRMTSLLEAFCGTYDYVLIDSPPIAVAADALILGRMTDGILMVTRPGVVNTGSAQTAKEALAKSNQNVLGMVVNGVVPDNEPDSYYYYYAKDYYGEDLSASDLKTEAEKLKSPT